jgi:hypothetical protein
LLPEWNLAVGPTISQFITQLRATHHLFFSDLEPITEAQWLHLLVLATGNILVPAYQFALKHVDRQLATQFEWYFSWPLLSVIDLQSLLTRDFIGITDVTRIDRRKNIARIAQVVVQQDWTQYLQFVESMTATNGHHSTVALVRATLLVEACRHGNMKWVSMLFPRASDESKWTGLMRACINGHQPVVCYYVEQGFDINRDEPGDIPIFVHLLAADESRLYIGRHYCLDDMADLLLANGADIVRQGQPRDFKPLFIAVQRRKYTILKTMLQRPAIEGYSEEELKDVVGMALLYSCLERDSQYWSFHQFAVDRQWIPLPMVRLRDGDNNESTNAKLQQIKLLFADCHYLQLRLKEGLERCMATN